MSGHTDRIDANLERIMNAAGSSLRHYMPSSKDKLREAMAEIEATHLATIEALVGALDLTSGALLAGQTTMSPRVKFIGDWAHLGTRTVSDILDAANDALSLVRGDR